jgi:hypothetical protein
MAKRKRTNNDRQNIHIKNMMTLHKTKENYFHPLHTSCTLMWSPFFVCSVCSSGAHISFAYILYFNVKSCFPLFYVRSSYFLYVCFVDRYIVVYNYFFGYLLNNWNCITVLGLSYRDNGCNNIYYIWNKVIKDYVLRFYLDFWCLTLFFKL